MALTWDQMQANAVAFAKRWRDGGREKQDAQSFVRALLGVFGVEPSAIEGGFELPVKIGGAGHDKYIDFIWPGKIAIEMKSGGKSLDEAFGQLGRYMEHLPDEADVPDLWLVSDFTLMRLCRRSTKETWNFKTADLRRHIRKFADIAGYATERAQGAQVEADVKAAEKMARLHDALKSSGYEGHALEAYLVRLLFCLFADDTGIFPQGAFASYIARSKPDGSGLSHRIADLFEVLNMPEEARKKKSLLSEELRRFRYINGGLFAERLAPADFDGKMRQSLLSCAAFDWSAISPAIFGAMFQGVMDPARRREMGAHYTSEENIKKLIDPLFMDELWEEFDRVKSDPKALSAFHGKIARLKFLDPACGCGNFLIIAYRELRLLELEILKMQAGGAQMLLDISDLLKVSVEQFYGVEYEEFPCRIATVGMWLIDHQMNMRVSDYFGQYYARLPLAQSATIVHGNALRIDWESVVPKQELSYILGNPPFVGASMMSAEQKSDAVAIFGKIKLSNSIDYVGAWYHKAAAYIQGTQIRVAFVSTNSITQGEQVAPLWGKLFNEYHVHIDYAHRTFKWGNEAKGKAAVHCVIVGFGACRNNIVQKRIYDNDGSIVFASNINAYLVDAPNVLVSSRGKPLCDVLPMVYGNKPTDDGNLILTPEEKSLLIEREPESALLIKKYIGSVEFINGKERFCLWLNDVPFSLLKNCPMVQERIKRVRAFRLKSSAKPTIEKADTPHLFFFISHPSNDYLVVPRVSSENRRYIPIGYLDKNTISSDSNSIVPNAKLYHFGILTSSVHMAWVRSVCGRLKSDYRYSGSIVYNNFPWPDATDEQKADIEKLAQSVLDARAQYPDSTLADMYGENSMPFHPALVKAHQALDRAVMKLYGFPASATEPEVAAALMARHQTLAAAAK